MNAHGPTLEGRPSLSAEEVGRLVRESFGIDGQLTPLVAEWDQNFRLDAADGSYVVKVANRGHADAVLDFQNAALERLSQCAIPVGTPRPVQSLENEGIARVRADDKIFYRIRLLFWLPGTPMSKAGEISLQTLELLGEALGKIDVCLEDFCHPAMDRQMRWDLRLASWISKNSVAIEDKRRRGIVERMLLQYQARVRPLLDDLPVSVIHNDANDDNVLLHRGPDDEWVVCGLLDFGDMLRTCTVFDPAIACAYSILGRDEPLEAALHLVSGYQRVRPLSEVELEVLFPLICMRLCVSVTNSAMVAREDPENEYRLVSEAPAWKMLERLETIDWRHAAGRFLSGAGFQPVNSKGKARQLELLEERRRRIGPSLSLSYREPIEIVRGRGQYLFDAQGRAYLDCVNNVCHVGHCHPKVVDALCRQAAELNTNSRYLHSALVEYAGRLTATLPEPLSVCYFVNSGSEANELAVRIARTYTGRRDAIVLEGAYHGNTQTLVDLSPYKCEGPGGHGLPSWAHKVVKPDTYRGPHRGSGEEVGRAYAGYVGAVCRDLKAAGIPPAFFICEPILGCGGQIVLPPGYLREAFRQVRAAGGLCIVDEVQVGMGRVGSRMWAFQTQDVIPDIVTIGKPIGNGHPLGAVVTTEEIARSFANGMEFFSTYGGNPVSMAVGLAVLDVIEEDGLMEHAERMGRYLHQGFEELAKTHHEIGDVRGLGLFMGVELVQDRETLEPATRKTGELVEFAKGEGILLSAEGPYHNVLKIKPPLPFSESDADLLLGLVDRGL